MVDHQPTFLGFDGHRSSTDLGALPAILDPHYKAVLSPVD